MECPDRDEADSPCIQPRQQSTSHWHGRGKSRRLGMDCTPGAKSTEGESQDINPIPINWKLCVESIQESENPAEVSTAGSRPENRSHTLEQLRPNIGDSSLFGRVQVGHKFGNHPGRFALRRHHECWISSAKPGLGEQPGEELQLSQVIVSSAPCTMQDHNQGIIADRILRELAWPQQSIRHPLKESRFISL